MVVLDPYLLVDLAAEERESTLSACQHAHFAVSDHLLQDDFPSDEYTQITAAITKEKIARLSVLAVDMADLMSTRNVLAFHQVATLATARRHRCLFASDCTAFRRIAGSVLKFDHILCGADVRMRFALTESTTRQHRIVEGRISRSLSRRGT
jgi:hypothetical protein